MRLFVGVQRCKLNGFTSLMRTVDCFSSVMRRAIFCCLSRCSVASVVSEKVLEATLPALRRTMLEVLYVARNMGFDETVLPARVIDSLLKVCLFLRVGFQMALTKPSIVHNQDVGH